MTVPQFQTSDALRDLLSIQSQLDALSWSRAFAFLVTSKSIFVELPRAGFVGVDSSIHVTCPCFRSRKSTTNFFSSISGLRGDEGLGQVACA